MHFIYSLVHLVLPNTEELISQSIEDPVDAPGHCKPQVPRFFWRWLQLLLFITSALVTIDVDGQICHFYSQGFVLSQILSVLKRRNPLENHASNTMGTNAFC